MKFILLYAMHIRKSDHELFKVNLMHYDAFNIYPLQCDIIHNFQIPSGKSYTVLSIKLRVLISNAAFR